jgi:hypothetical protein
MLVLLIGVYYKDPAAARIYSRIGPRGSFPVPIDAG